MAVFDFFFLIFTFHVHVCVCVRACMKCNEFLYIFMTVLLYVNVRKILFNLMYLCVYNHTSEPCKGNLWISIHLWIFMSVLCLKYLCLYLEQVVFLGFWPHKRSGHFFYFSICTFLFPRSSLQLSIYHSLFLFKVIRVFGNKVGLLKRFIL